MIILLKIHSLIKISKILQNQVNRYKNINKKIKEKLYKKVIS